jgi:hypothetical protein
LRIYDEAVLERMGFVKVARPDGFCGKCQRRIEWWEDRLQHKVPFIRTKGGKLAPHYSACRGVVKASKTVRAKVKKWED